ncbi:hypothetical protein LZ30DRAFT_296837 [Colletotrichum cereale]|nr:hypothetical protein LZ30DRAFT_296837 [Colletotrichum cereale]
MPWHTTMFPPSSCTSVPASPLPRQSSAVQPPTPAWNSLPIPLLGVAPPDRRPQTPVQSRISVVNSSQSAPRFRRPLSPPHGNFFGLGGFAERASLGFPSPQEPPWALSSPPSPPCHPCPWTPAAHGTPTLEPCLGLCEQQQQRPPPPGPGPFLLQPVCFTPMPFDPSVLSSVSCPSPCVCPSPFCTANSLLSSRYPPFHPFFLFLLPPCTL